MRLPFLWIGSGFCFGILAEKYAGVPLSWVWFGLGAGMLLAWFLRKNRFFLPVFLLSMALVGFLWARLDAHVPANAVQHFTGDGRVTLRGGVVSLPEVKTRGKKQTVSLVLKARSITRMEGNRRKFYKISGNVQAFLIQSPLVPQVGDELRLYGELTLPKQILNPGEFDYRKFLAQKNIHALFQSIGPKCVRVTRPGSPWAPSRVIAETRRRLAMLVDKIYKPREAAIVKALVLGLRTDIPPEVRDQFMKTGTIHLLAISGMNITMVAGTFYLIFLFCGLGFRKAACVTAFIATVYVGLAGAGIPIQRAGYGAVLVLLASIVGRPSNLLNSLCFSFFVILVWAPQSLWNIGFQLSFLCVLSLILILPLLTRINVWTLSLGSSLAVLFGTFPVVLYYFNIFSPVSLLANLVAIPLCDAALFTALFSLLFSSIPVLNTVFVKASSWIIAGSLAWVKGLSSWGWGYWFLERPSLWHLGAYYASVGIILSVYRRSFQGKRWVMGALICGWLGLSVCFAVGSGDTCFELTFLASGRNQIAHARFSNGAHWNINAGRNFPSDQGEWLIAPYLRSRGVQRLEGVWLTDLSKKNAGGLASVLRDFPIQHLLVAEPFFSQGEEFYSLIRKLGRKVKRLGKGDAVMMGAEALRVAALSEKGMVLRVETGPWRILLVSKWDAELFSQLTQAGAGEEIHAVFLPAAGRALPGEFLKWVDQQPPLLVVSPDVDPEVEVSLVSRRIPFLSLKRLGALNFRRKGERLEVDSFLNGLLGFYSFL